MDQHWTRTWCWSGSRIERVCHYLWSALMAEGRVKVRQCALCRWTPAWNPSRWHNTGLMLDQRLRRWPSSKPALCQRLRFAGWTLAWNTCDRPPALPAISCQLAACADSDGRLLFLHDWQSSDWIWSLNWHGTSQWSKPSRNISRHIRIFFVRSYS